MSPSSRCGSSASAGTRVGDCLKVHFNHDARGLYCGSARLAGAWGSSRVRALAGERQPLLGGSPHHRSEAAEPQPIVVQVRLLCLCVCVRPLMLVALVFVVDWRWVHKLLPCSGWAM